MALAIAAVFPLVVSFVGFLRARRLDLTGIPVLLGIGISMIGVALGDDHCDDRLDDRLREAIPPAGRRARGSRGWAGSSITEWRRLIDLAPALVRGPRVVYNDAIQREEDTMLTMDFETYVNSEVPAAERSELLAGILRDEDAAGIEYAVVMPNPTAHPNNRALHETVRTERRVVACAQVNPNDPTAIADVETALTTLGMRCLKIMPTLYNLDLLGPLAFALMDKAREHHAVVNIHSGGNLSHPLRIGAVARRYPEVSIIMDHMGYREWGHDAIVAAQDNPNLYLGTTIASFEGSSVIGAVKALGPERVIYGSNAPALYSDLAVESIRRCKLGREAEELVLGGNLARLFGMG